MREEEMVLALVAMLGSFALLWGLGHAIFSWLKARHQQIDPHVVASLQQQIAQVQMSVDAMALEVERVSEGQRFVTKLLAERGDPARLPGGREDR
jgi:hypothetical protein